MKKLISALVASAVLGGLAFADEIDDQIQQLEKQNKLLELQKKNQALQGNQNNTNHTNSSKATKAKNPNSKNGFFLGLEGNLGSVNTILSVNTISATASSTTFDLGLLGGYQHYFGQSQRHGIKVSAHLYSGFGNSWDYSLFNTKGSVSYLPIKFGLDIKYAWDFLERGKHTLGLNVGLGYGFDVYVNGEEESNNIKAKTKNIFNNGFYPVLGLHYYYGHHQFEVLYRFGGAIASTTTKEIIEDRNIKMNLSLTSQSYLTFNYVYRF